MPPNFKVVTASLAQILFGSKSASGSVPTPVHPLSTVQCMSNASPAINYGHNPVRFSPVPVRVQSGFRPGSVRVLSGSSPGPVLVQSGPGLGSWCPARFWLRFKSRSSSVSDTGPVRVRRPSHSDRCDSAVITTAAATAGQPSDAR